MTPLDKLLARLRELEEDATKIPWRQQTGAIIKGNGDLVFDSMPGHAYPALDTDVQLIAESRNALPVLLEIIERQREALALYADFKNWWGEDGFLFQNNFIPDPQDYSQLPGATIMTAGEKSRKAIAECDALAETVK